MYVEKNDYAFSQTGFYHKTNPNLFFRKGSDQKFLVEHRRFELLTSTMRMSRATKYSSLYPLSRKTLVIYSISTKDLLNPFYPKSNLPLPLNTYRIRIAHPRFSSKPMCTYYLLHVTIPNHLFTCNFYKVMLQ